MGTVPVKAPRAIKPARVKAGGKARPALKEPAAAVASELVIITGMSGSGKASVLRALEDLGYYAVDNLPIDLIPTFAELVRDSATIRHAALVIDVREGSGLRKLPVIHRKIKKSVNARLVFLEADDASLLRRFSETRRPHPLSDRRNPNDGQPIAENIAKERTMLAPIRALADLTIDTSKFNVHDLRDFIRGQFRGEKEASKMVIYVTSFGFRHGLPPDCDLVFDVRFLPNPNYIPKFKQLTGRNPAVAKYIRSFPQTDEFIERVTESADLACAALHSRGEDVSHDRIRVHGRTSSVGHDRRSDTQEPRGGRLSGQGHAPRRGEAGLAGCRRVGSSRLWCARVVWHRGQARTRC